MPVEEIFIEGRNDIADTKIWLNVLLRDYVKNNGEEKLKEEIGKVMAEEFYRKNKLEDDE